VLTTWSVLAVGAGVLAAVVVPGVWLWWPSRRESASQRELGMALMTGTVIAFAVLAVQGLFELRLARLEDERAGAQAARDLKLAQEADRRDLALTIGLQRDLRGIDLREHDLRGFYMAKKDLREVQLLGARLENVVFWAANLTGADLRGARMNGAMLEDARLNGAWLTRADLRGASLRGALLEEADLSGADLRGAKLEGANLTGAALGDARLDGALYDSTTSWPISVPVPRCRADSCEVPGI
jgi:uncharacterized protein YjbI with pentapeptide repeats